LDIKIVNANMETDTIKIFSLIIIHHITESCYFNNITLFVTFSSYM